jgi:receptor protein-tyrosine kinase
MNDMGVSPVAPGNAGGSQPNFVFTPGLRVATEPDSLIAESIRSLRTVVIAQHLQNGRRSLAICGPSAGVGCSFIAANLAVAMAQAGVNTLLVDANLRDPAIQEYIEPSEPLLGLSDALKDDALGWGNFVHRVQPSLAVLYAGNAQTVAFDRIGGDAFRSIMSSCLRDFDLTIFDTPPSNRYADARRVASVARHALVVARRQRTYLRDVRVLVEELETDRTNVIGTYLNDC